MLKKILSFFLLIFVFLSSSCEDYYNFEAKKLHEKAKELIEESNNSAFNIDEKIIYVKKAIENLNKLQKKYPKTKIAKSLKKNNKINNLNTYLKNLEKESNLGKIENEKKQVLTYIKKKTDIANIEFKRRNFVNASLLVLDAAEKSIVEIDDPRSKIRLLNKIGEARFNLKDNKGALKVINNSLNFIDQMHVDLPKKIMHLSKIYEMLYLLGENEKYKSVEKKIYKIINNDINNNNNKSVAFSEIAKSNYKINDIDQAKINIKEALKLAESSAAYLAIANVQYMIAELNECEKTIILAKEKAVSTKQEFWNVRELINIALFENSISLKESSEKTLLEAEKFVLANPDGRIILELVEAFAKINNINKAKSLINKIHPHYEKAYAMSIVGEELGKRNNISEMNLFLNKAINAAPDVIEGKYALGLPGFSTKGRIYLSVAKAYAEVNNFKKAYKLLSSIESDRFYKEGIFDILLLQSKKDREDTKKKSLLILTFGGTILDNKFMSKIAIIQSISGDLENSFKTINQITPSIDLSESLINIAININPQQVDPSI